MFKIVEFFIFIFRCRSVVVSAARRRRPTSIPSFLFQYRRLPVGTSCGRMIRPVRQKIMSKVRQKVTSKPPPIFDGRGRHIKLVWLRSLSGDHVTLKLPFNFRFKFVTQSGNMKNFLILERDYFQD